MPDPVTKITWDNPLLLSVADAKRPRRERRRSRRRSTRHGTTRSPSRRAAARPGQGRGRPGARLRPHRRQRGRGRGRQRLPADGHRSRVREPAPRRARGQGRRHQDPLPHPGAPPHGGPRHRAVLHAWPSTPGGHRAAPGGPSWSPSTPIRSSPSTSGAWPSTSPPAWAAAAACVACQSENNVAVVGPEQVTRGREMHWIRIDRYYEGDADNPKVVHQPMLCQHCDNAPCENVCPVNATNHSPDGLNQMAYNRCVGTRYCANNCPYKVRRFNFLDFTADKARAREPGLQPRGDGAAPRRHGEVHLLRAAHRGREAAAPRARAGPCATARSRPPAPSACPADAIVFGDLKDPESQVSQLVADQPRLSGPGGARRPARHHLPGRPEEPRPGRRQP